MVRPFPSVGEGSLSLGTRIMKKTCAEQHDKYLSRRPPPRCSASATGSTTSWSSASPEHALGRGVSSACGLAQQPPSARRVYTVRSDVQSMRLCASPRCWRGREGDVRLWRLVLPPWLPRPSATAPFDFLLSAASPSRSSVRFNGGVVQVCEQLRRTNASARLHTLREHVSQRRRRAQ